MIYAIANRVEFIRHLPKGMRIAEIGTQLGNYAAAMLRELQPAELHMIDPWTHHDDPDYKHDPANQNQHAQDGVFERVQQRFEKEIAAGIVHLHRAASPSAADRFPDSYFDMVYVDGMHYHAAVLRDLDAFAPKLKRGGILSGHDFCEHSNSAAMNFGVVSAVSTFVRRSGYRAAFVTGKEDFPSYFLADGHETWIDTAISSLRAANYECLELPDSLLPNFNHSFIKLENGQKRNIPSFV